MKQLRNIELLTVLIITLLGIIQGQVTVFYIIYLFWFQELIRTIVDVIFLIQQKKKIGDKIESIQISFGSFFMLFIYFVFIVVLFGFMLNWSNSELLRQNMLVLLFRNWYFNINLLLFLTEYIVFRYNADNSRITLPLFSRRHIVLHISIIMGAIIQLVIIPNFNFKNNRWTFAIVILPFLLLKFFLDKEVYEKKNEDIN